MKKLLIALAFVLAATTAMAVPNLQLYTPEGTYDPITETWIVNVNPFELQVIGAWQNGNVLEIHDLYLDIAIPENCWVTPGSITLTGPGYAGGVTLLDSDFAIGTPDGQSPHGIYPTYFHSLALPTMDFDNSTLVTVQDMPGGGTDEGLIYSYSVSVEGFECVHFDAHGTEVAKNLNERDVFAPYSHDAEYQGDGDGFIPEPASASLLVGALGILAFRRRRA